MAEFQELSQILKETDILKDNEATTQTEVKTKKKKSSLKLNQDSVRNIQKKNMERELEENSRRGWSVI